MKPTALATMLLTAWERGYGLWAGWRIAHPWRIWATTAFTLIALEVLPWQLAHWVPHMHSALGELFSAIARIGAAGLLAVMGCLLLLALWTQAVQEQAPRTRWGECERCDRPSRMRERGASKLPLADGTMAHPCLIELTWTPWRRPGNALIPRAGLWGGGAASKFGAVAPLHFC